MTRLTEIDIPFELPNGYTNTAAVSLVTCEDGYRTVGITVRAQVPSCADMPPDLRRFRAIAGRYLRTARMVGDEDHVSVRTVRYEGFAK